MEVPFIYTSERTFIQEASGFDNVEGVKYQEVGGEHSIWAARVPFLPAMLSNDFVRIGLQRASVIQKRMERFICDLARAGENQATFELRFISTPNPVAGHPNLIDIIFLGKVFSKRQHAGQAQAERLWEKFVSNYPLEDPFDYPLEPVTDEAAFWQYYQPIPFDQIEADHLIEIRKYEDMLVHSMNPVGRVERKGDYIFHPFVPSQDLNPMGRFFTALASQTQKCYAGISLRPARMFDQEIYNVGFAWGKFSETLHKEEEVEEYYRFRSAIGEYVYRQLMENREQLVMVRVYLVGEHESPYGLTEGLGSEMVGNVDNKYPTRWTAVQPGNDGEMATALNNLRYLEHDIWGHTLASPPLLRLRYLATAWEAFGAFRLPVPPESGYMPGILVKNEPFVALPDELELQRIASSIANETLMESSGKPVQKKVSLGTVYHRGNPTSQPFQIVVRDLTRHSLIAGSTGSGKSTTIKHILSQLWLKHRVPFLVLYPIDKTDYRELRGFEALRKDLLIFTLGDVSTSPFRFNPFEVPDGLLLKTHLSRLMRVFMAAFTLQDPLPMVYREALRQVYRSKGWDTVLERGGPGREYPVMSEFYETIRKITDELEYGREVKDNVRQASVIRIADLLENAGHVVNVRRSMPFGTLLNLPTIMEIGRVGSVQDTSLLMGFLLMRFAEEIERNPRPLDLPHITVVEEAHRLMMEVAPSLAAGDTRSAAGEDFANILAEVRGYGEGIIIAEQIPTLLVKGAIGNTYIKIMHWLEDAPSFELYGSIMNLNGQQREYARTLTPGFAIVRSQSGRPVHIKVPEFGEADGFDKAASKDISDEQIKAEMDRQRVLHGLADVPVIAWDSSLTASSSEKKPWRAAPDVLGWLVNAPLQTCALCKPLHAEGKCLYGQRVRNRLLSDAGFLQSNETLILAGAGSSDMRQRWSKLREMGAQVEAQSPDLAGDQKRDLVYCYLAHEVDRLGRGSFADLEKRRSLRSLVLQFEKEYGPAGKS